MARLVGLTSCLAECETDEDVGDEDEIDGVEVVVVVAVRGAVPSCGGGCWNRA